MLITQQVDLPAQLAAAPDAVLNTLLNRLGQAQVLLLRAAEAGIGPAEEHVDSLDSLARQGVRDVTDGPRPSQDCSLGG